MAVLLVLAEDHRKNYSSDTCRAKMLALSWLLQHYFTTAKI